VLVGPVGLDLQTPESPGSDTLADLSLLTTTLVTLLVGLVGWLTVTLLERGLGGERGRRIWVLLAVGVFLVSLLPIAALDVGTGAQWGLAVLHLLVAAVLIPTLANGTPAEHPVAGGWVEAHASAATAHEATHDEAQHDAAADPAGDPAHH
jgi:peptidoglycan/LPS O-acetylase OafA/YrhL